MGSKKLGPPMTWLNGIPNQGLIPLFNKQFFGESRQMRSAFKLGVTLVSHSVAREMVVWWRSFGVTITLHQIRPDIYGPEDKGSGV